MHWWYSPHVEYVLAGQADCNKDLLIYEFIAFGHLCSGGLYKELQHNTFGNALVHELDSLIVDVEANWLEGVMVGITSLLLSQLITCILRPSGSKVLAFFVQCTRRYFPKYKSYWISLQEHLGMRNLLGFCETLLLFVEAHPILTWQWLNGSFTLQKMDLVKLWRNPF